MDKDKQEERKWWQDHINEESELRKPHRTRWEYLQWEKLFSILISHYDFSNKKIFVGCCGTGIFEDAISKYEPSIKEVTGLDLTPNFIKLAMIRNEHNEKTKFVIGDLEETNLENNYFDVSVIIDGLHHVPHPFIALKEMRRISRDLIFSEPNALNPIRRINELKYRKQGVRESSFYEWQLLSWLRSCHYNDIVVFNTGFVPSFTPEIIIEFCSGSEDILRRVPLFKKIGGGLLVIAKSEK